jgi:rhomboid protease GlpG
MRQLGTLPDEPAARRFAAWLVSQRIEAHAEQESSGWVIWVRDEDRLPRAREALAHFREQPQDARYQNAEASAQALLREDEARRQQALKNVVQMRGRWSSGSALGGAGPRRCPLVMVLIGLSILVTLATNDRDERFRQAIEANQEVQHNPIEALFAFTDPSGPFSPETGYDLWVSLRHGEIWRLITPIFLHFGWSHLIFNMLCLYSFGGQIEDRRGTAMLAGLVLLLAAMSNVGQAIEQTARGHGVLFGGMSGVDYGLFGYMLVKVKFDNRDRYLLSPITTFVALLWFGLCIAAEFPPFDSLIGGTIGGIANTAHAVGLLLGAALAYAPLLMRKPA